jgi:hypothetical protein
MRKVVLVAKQQLQSVRAERQLHFCFRLSEAEMQMVEVVRDRLVGLRQRCVDQQVMMASVGLLHTAGATPMPTNPKHTTVSGENSGAGANAKRRQLSAEPVWIERYGRQCGRVAGGLLERELQRRSVSRVGLDKRKLLATSVALRVFRHAVGLSQIRGAISL